MSLRSAIVPGCRLELTVLRRHLSDEKAANLVAEVADGKISPWILPWVPLMQGGAESGIITAWLREAQRGLTDEHDRADVGLITQVFAALAGCRAAWEHALRGWNMQTSPVFDEIRALGRAEGLRAMVLRLGQKKFGKAPAKKQQKALEAITDPDRLEAVVERLLGVDSWDDLFSEI